MMTGRRVTQGGVGWGTGATGQGGSNARRLAGSATGAGRAAPHGCSLVCVQANVVGALAAGIPAVRFESAEQLESELRRHGVPI